MSARLPCDPAQERDGLSSIRGVITVMAAVAMTASACAGEAEIPELTASPVPAPTGMDLVPPLPDWRAAQPPPAEVEAPATSDDAETASESGEGSETVAPSYDAERAAFLYARVEEAEAADHLAYDLLGDGVPELVVVAHTAAGRLDVTLAAWNGEAYVEVGMATAVVTPERLGTPVARDLTGDGRREVVAPFVDEAGPAALTLAVTDDGDLAPFETCPVDAPQQHRLRLKASRDATDVTLSCDEAPVDGVATVLQWQGGLFVTVPDAPRSTDAPPVPDDTTDGHGEDGRGGDGHAPPGRSQERDRELAPGPPHADDPADKPGRRRGQDPAHERGRGNAPDDDA